MGRKWAQKPTRPATHPFHGTGMDRWEGAFSGLGRDRGWWRRDDLEERVARRVEQFGRGGTDDLLQEFPVVEEPPFEMLSACWVTLRMRPLKIRAWRGYSAYQ